MTTTLKQYRMKEKKYITGNLTNHNGVSLQLRTKEISDAMGSIPAWLTSWGSLLMLCLFIVSLTLIFNIHSRQQVRGRLIAGRTGLIITLPADAYGNTRAAKDIFILPAGWQQPMISTSRDVASVYKVVRTGEATCYLQVNASPEMISRIGKLYPAGVDAAITLSVPVFPPASISH